MRNFLDIKNSTAAIIVLLLGLIVNLTFISANPKNTLKNTCQNKACIRVGSYLKRDLDLIKDPCDDFYNFTCGKFIENEKILEQYDFFNRFLNDSLKIKGKLISSLRKDITESDSEAIKKLKTFFQMCEKGDFNTSKELKIKELTEIFNKLSKFTGAWPVVSGESWNKSHTTWIALIGLFRDFGFKSNYFFETSFIMDPSNLTQRLLYIEVPSLSINSLDLMKGLESNATKNYFEKLIELATLFNASDQNIFQKLNKSLNFEIELAKIQHLTTHSSSDYSQEIITISELKKNYPYLDWDSYLQMMIPFRKNLNNDDKIGIYQPKLVNKSLSLLKRTSDEVIANYAFSRFIYDVNDQYLNLTINNCFSKVSEKLTTAAHALYIRDHFDMSSKTMILDMIENIRSTTKKLLSDISWIDDSTKQALVKKVNQIKFLTLFPEGLLGSKLDEHYKELIINPNNSLQTLFNVNAFLLKNDERSLKAESKSQGHEDNWINELKPTDINSMYHIMEKTIILPVGILQGITFDKSLPNYVNYATLGSIISHEITHYLDYIFLGQKRNTNPDFSKTWEQYKNKTNCIQNQLMGYTNPIVGINMISSFTLQEIVSDSIGMKIAFSAYETWKKINNSGRDEKSLPGIENFTNEQVFWMSNSMMACTKYSDNEALKKKIKKSKYPLEEFRTTIRVNNQPEFFKSFRCSKNSKMRDRCEFF